MLKYAKILIPLIPATNFRTEFSGQKHRILKPSLDQCKGERYMHQIISLVCWDIVCGINPKEKCLPPIKSRFEIMGVWILPQGAQDSSKYYISV